MRSLGREETGAEGGRACMIDWTKFDAVLFDLDGVLTKTATVHATCWKRTFDDFLRGQW